VNGAGQMVPRQHIPIGFQMNPVEMGLQWRLLMEMEIKMIGKRFQDSGMTSQLMKQIMKEAMSVNMIHHHAPMDGHIWSTQVNATSQMIQLLPGPKPFVPVKQLTQRHTLLLFLTRLQMTLSFQWSKLEA